jgi:hypothetical protein
MMMPSTSVLFSTGMPSPGAGLAAGAAGVSGAAAAGVLGLAAPAVSSLSAPPAIPAARNNAMTFIDETRMMPPGSV